MPTGYAAVRLTCAWPFQLKVGTPVTPALGNGLNNSGFPPPICFPVRSPYGRTDRQTERRARRVLLPMRRRHVNKQISFITRSSVQLWPKANGWVYLGTNYPPTSCKLSTADLLYFLGCRLTKKALLMMGNDQNGPKPKRPTRMSKTAHVISPKWPLLGRFGWPKRRHPKRPTQRSKMAPTQTEMTKTAQK